MNTRTVVRAAVVLALISGGSTVLEAQDAWNLPVDRAHMMRVGETKTSALDAADRKLEDDSYYEAWYFQGRAGQRFTVTMTSEAFDTYMAVGQHQGEMLKSNDDHPGAGGTNSRVSLVLPADGIYVIRANSLGAGETGQFGLTLTAGAPPTEADVFAGPVGNDRMLQSGRQVSDSFDASDTKYEDDAYFQVYAIQLSAGQSVTVTMRSGSFDTFLMLAPQGAKEAAASNDDADEGSTDSRIQFTATTSGPHLIVAKTYGAGSSGDYTLVATIAGSAPAGGALGDILGGAGGTTPAPSGNRSISVGQTVNGELAEGDGKLDDESFFDEWMLEGRAGDRITISLNSSEFDAVLFLHDAGDNRIAENDDVEEGNTNSSITITLPATGRFRILANSYEAGERGRYTLSVTRAP